MNNKKSVMVFSALQILIFHLWIYVSKSPIEMFIKQTAYIGVDIFFLLSAFSLAKYKDKPIKYLNFVWSRFKTIYIKFILFAIIAYFYVNWPIKRLGAVITGQELFIKGGGSFLWFIPAIMLFYLIYPLFQKCDNKNRIVTIIGTITLWIIGAYLVSTYIPVIAIMWNRLPIFFLGYYLYDIQFLKDKTVQIILGTLLTFIGIILVSTYAYTIKLQVPFRDMFYLIIIPLAVGLTMLIGLIPECKVTKILGSCTLEMYAIQMVFGYNFANMMLKQTKNILVVNLCTITFVIVSSIIVNMIFKYIGKGISFLIKRGTNNESKN